MASTATQSSPPASAAAGHSGSATADLADAVETSRMYSLNLRQADGSDWKDVIRAGRRVSSDADDQVIIFLPFRSPVKLKAIKVDAPSSTTTDDSGDAVAPPRKLRIYANMTTLGFEDVDDIPATQEFDLDDKALAKEGQSQCTRYAKFQNVTSLFLFLENGDADHIVFDRILLQGMSQEAMDVSKLKKVG